VLSHARRAAAAGPGATYTVHAVVRIPADAPIMRGRVELTHIVLIEAANNLSHWMTARVPAVASVRFKPPLTRPSRRQRPSASSAMRGV
jgi:hypothetical protein